MAGGHGRPRACPKGSGQLLDDLLAGIETEQEEAQQPQEGGDHEQAGKVIEQPCRAHEQEQEGGYDHRSFAGHHLDGTTIERTR
mgnify:CR=1 FL=1